MNASENEILSPEWPGDFNETMGMFLQEYRRHASRNRQRRTWAGMMFGVSAVSVLLAAAWPVAKSAIG
jgi:hypothetical protein